MNVAARASVPVLVLLALSACSTTEDHASAGSVTSGAAGTSTTSEAGSTPTTGSASLADIPFPPSAVVGKVRSVSYELETWKVEADLGAVPAHRAFAQARSALSSSGFTPTSGGGLPMAYFRSADFWVRITIGQGDRTTVAYEIKPNTLAE